MNIVFPLFFITFLIHILNIQLFYLIVVCSYLISLFFYKNYSKKILFIGFIIVLLVLEYIFHQYIIEYIFDVHKEYLHMYINTLPNLENFIYMNIFMYSYRNVRYANLLYVSIFPFLFIDNYSFLFAYIIYILLYNRHYILEFIQTNYKKLIIFICIYIFIVFGLYYDNLIYFIFSLKNIFYSNIYIFLFISIIFYARLREKLLIFLFMEYIFLFPFLFDKFLYLEILMKFLSISYLISFVFNYREYIKIIISNKNLLLFLLILTLFAISTIVSYTLFPNSKYFYFDENLQFLMDHLLLFLVLILVFITIIPKIYYNYIVYIFLGSIFISEIFSYLIYFQLIDFDYLKSIGLLFEQATKCNPSPFTNHINYSVFVAISIIILLYKFINENNKFLKGIFVSLFIFEFINLFLNGGRTGQLINFISIVLFIIIYKKNIIRNMSIFILSIFILFSIKTDCNNNQRLLVGINSLQKINNNNNYQTSWGKRVGINITAIDYLFESPCHFICGSGAYRTKSEWDKQILKMPIDIQKAIKSKEKTEPIHSEIFQIWFNGGIFALILYFLMLYLFARESKQNNKVIIYSLLIVILIYSLQDRLIVGLYANTYSLFIILWIFIVIFSNDGLDKKEKK